MSIDFYLNDDLERELSQMHLRGANEELRVREPLLFSLFAFDD